jgi:hypothetical protein
MAAQVCGPSLLLFLAFFGSLAVITVMMTTFALPQHHQRAPIVVNNISTKPEGTAALQLAGGVATVPPSVTPPPPPPPPPPRPPLLLPPGTNSSSSGGGSGTHAVPPAMRRASPLNPWKKPKGAIDLHFIHIPKCGGTSMTAILREVACTIDPARNVDCCTNKGFCDYNDNKRCNSIRGCINHFPNRPWIFKPQPSITILRDPVSRLLSAWFYRGHSPNLDFFQVRPWFKEIKDGKRPKVVFDEYIEMVEYQNIQTRMLGADSFPYRDVPITPEVFDKAVDALNHLFFVGVQEAYDLSVQVMLRELNVPAQVDVKKERDQQSSKSIAKQKAAIKNNATLLARVREVNAYDVKLYKLGLVKFCTAAKKYDDLYTLLKQTTSVDCDAALAT